MYQITREYWFSAAHRLEGHPKCGRLHGHNYQVIIGLMQRGTMIDGWVMDYGAMDAVLKPLIEDFDHRYLVSQENADHNCPYLQAALERKDALVLPIQRSTAELLADFLYGLIQERLGSYGVLISYVKVCETPKSSAVFGEY